MIRRALSAGSWLPIAPGALLLWLAKRQPVAGLSAQEVYTVRGVINEKVELVSSSGENRLIDVKRTGARLEIGRMATIELLPGDRVLFRANAEGFVNGQLGIVAGKDDQGWLVTSDGRSGVSAVLATEPRVRDHQPYGSGCDGAACSGFWSQVRCQRTLCVFKPS